MGLPPVFFGNNRRSTAAQGDKRVYDVVSSASGEVELLPVEGSSPRTRLQVAKLPDDAVVTIRVFRFLEDYSDAKETWEKGLRNVNSGSLLWLAVHMLPQMHSVRGAKYGEWFTIHHIRVYARHFKSGYHMCNSGSSGPAETFGSSTAVKSLVTGDKLREGYFWFVSPVDELSKPSLEKDGWQHVKMEGPFDGSSVAQECESVSPSSIAAKQLQQVVRNVNVV
mmetsp:Transcript_70937/g.154118  ORF Transcript_70937/g.154118 Transcript_70937/m.154118 type:complete len:223 (-) Transcript_70937:178-846(-)